MLSLTFALVDHVNVGQQIAFGLLKCSASSGHLNRGSGLHYFGAKRLHAAERRMWIGSGREVAQPRRPLGQPGQHGIAVRYGLVAGNGN